MCDRPIMNILLNKHLTDILVYLRDISDVVNSVSFYIVCPLTSTDKFVARCSTWSQFFSDQISGSLSGSFVYVRNQTLITALKNTLLWPILIQ